MSEKLLEAPTIWELVRRRAGCPGPRRCCSTRRAGGSSWTDFAALAERTAAGLQAQGIGPGTKVTWQLPTRIDSVVVSMALARLGAVQNPVLHLYREREVGAVLRQSRPEFFLVPGVWRDRDFAAMAKSLAAELTRRRQLLELG